MVELVGGAPFVQPPVVDSRAGVLDVVLDLEHAELEAAARSAEGGEKLRFHLSTRALNASLPGPTLRVLPGDTLRVLYRNRMPLPEEIPKPCVQANGAASKWAQEYCRPDTSNLHWHGLHAREKLPGDDARLLVTPGGSFQYETLIPADHMPGTAHVHPHVHGSSNLQVAGGAALALIVRDPPGFLPEELEEISGGLRDLVWVVQRFQLNTLLAAAAKAGDRRTQARLSRGDLASRGTREVLNVSSLGAKELGGINDFVLVNGVFRPMLHLEEGLWHRWRVVYAGWLAGSLDFAVSGPSCEVALLAKDGVYLRDFPRRLRGPARVPAGGRADLLVRCFRPRAGEDSVDVTAVDGRAIATLRVEAAAKGTGQLAPRGSLRRWAPPWPRYLVDTQSEEPSPGCSCLTVMGACSDSGPSNCLNGRPYDPGYVTHVTHADAVVERRVMGLESHPYHQHMYPFQLIDGFPASDYFRPGDWHDTWLDTALPKSASKMGMAGRMRYRTTSTVVGRMMVHCHRLGHEDLGMMSTELISAGNRTPCRCDTFLPPSLGGPAVAVALLASLRGGPSSEDLLDRAALGALLAAASLLLSLLGWRCLRRAAAPEEGARTRCDCYTRL